MRRTSGTGSGGRVVRRRDGRRRRVQVRRDVLDGRLALERALAREDLVEDDAEAVDVAPPVERRAVPERPELLRRPVRDLSEEEPRRGQGLEARRLLEELRDAEVEELDDAGRRRAR